MIKRTNRIFLRFLGWLTSWSLNWLQPHSKNKEVSPGSYCTVQTHNSLYNTMCYFNTSVFVQIK